MQNPVSALSPAGEAIRNMKPRPVIMTKWGPMMKDGKRPEGGLIHRADREWARCETSPAGFPIIKAGAAVKHSAWCCRSQPSHDLTLNLNLQSAQTSTYRHARTVAAGRKQGRCVSMRLLTAKGLTNVCSTTDASVLVTALAWLKTPQTAPCLA